MYKAKEGLNNAFRHSRASAVEIALMMPDNQRLDVQVQDNGVGFDPHSVKQGLGLTSVTSRVREIGGKFGVPTVEELGGLGVGPSSPGFLVVKSKANFKE